MEEVFPQSPMKLRKLFDTCIDIGMQYDVRGPTALKKHMEEMKKEFESMPKEKQKFFDRERLRNPYHDSRILTGDGDEQVTMCMVGIDLDVQQILVADRLRERGEEIDALFLHHPQGRASVEMAEDMRLQTELYRKYDVPVVHIEQQLEEKIEETKRDSHGDNIFEWQKTAELLEFAGLCVHTPADNLVYQFLEKGICRDEYENIGELMNALLEIPEFEYYAKHGLPPLLINCTEKSRTGILAPTGMTGGTDGPPSFMEEESRAGIGTVLTMHTSTANKEMAEKCHINIIQLNHYAADALGVNLLLDLLQRKDKKLKFLAGCGFNRIERTDKELKILTTPADKAKRKPGSIGNK
jgi:hypothetical protein